MPCSDTPGGVPGTCHLAGPLGACEVPETQLCGSEPAGKG